jgi:glycosyltransferase involved in cell wall biosynthesis
MRVLFVAMANSIHSVRWISQVLDQGWDIHLFPAQPGGVHSGFRNLTVHQFLAYRQPDLDQSVRIAGAWPYRHGASVARRLIGKYAAPYTNHAYLLARTIQRLQPDVIHSLELQHAGYLVLEARRYLTGPMPPWAVTNWGSDIYLFGRLAEHVPRIKALLAACDYYTCECRRDVQLAREMGFAGEVLPVVPIAGGYDLAARDWRAPGPISGRRRIALKGYQTWAGRALAGLRAIELCADVLRDYAIDVYLAGPEVRIAAELLADSTGLNIRCVPRSSHAEMLRLHGQARVSIGLSISDAISTSFLEAILMGAFPIQSHTSCASEWIEDGKTGLLVHPEDPRQIAAALRRAVTDDKLVDRAAPINVATVSQRLDLHRIRPQVVAMYEQIARQGVIG